MLPFLATPEAVGVPGAPTSPPQIFGRRLRSDEEQYSSKKLRTTSLPSLGQ